MEAYQKRLEDAAAIVMAAGDEAQRARKHLRVEHKADNDYVTQVDQSTEESIRHALLEKYPEDGFLGEEFGIRGNTEQYWVLDPIDGTTNYIRGMEEYAVSLAYISCGRPVIGVVYCPAIGTVYTAVKGGGAFRNGEAIHVTEDPTLRDTVVGMSFAHRHSQHADSIHKLVATLMTRAGDMRRSGSAALDLCRVAEGCYGAFVEPCLNIYDIAAGTLIVEEAGGIVTGFPTQEDALITGNTLAGTPALHPILKNIVADCFDLR